MNYLSLDVGTTCCKCQLFSEQGDILEYVAEEYDFREEDGESYVDVDAVWSKLKGMIANIAARREITSICVSSLGEAFVLLDGNDRVLFYPMLYTDPRGEAEAAEIIGKIGERKAFSVTGVMPHSMYSLSKLLWIKNNKPGVYARAEKLLLVGEYVGYLLTGERAIDYGLAARTGVFDVGKLEFSEEILGEFGIPVSLFSPPKKTGSVVGKMKADLAAELGLKNRPTLVLGSHDQVCTALGAGVLEEGDAVDGMGTVECITTLFSSKPDDVRMGRQGYPCVPYAVDGLYCTYILNFSCGSTVNWLRKKIMHGYSGGEKDFFTYAEAGMKDGPTGILALPYFGGASTPYQDLSATGAIVGLTLDTADSDLYKSIMEGTAMEMALNAEVVREYGIDVANVVATGGGANSAKWMQIKADVQNVPVRILRSSEGGLCGCAMLQAVAMKGAKDLFEARDVFVRYADRFEPDSANAAAYRPQYEKYKKLYKVLKEELK